MNYTAKNLTKWMAYNAIFIATYVALVFILGDLSFGFANGIISFRVAEILIILCCYEKRLIPGAVLACFLANLFSGNVVDLIIGPIQTLISVYLLYKIKNKILAVIFASLVCGIIIGLEIYLLGFSVIGIYVIFTTFLGELIILLLGYLLFIRVKNIKKIKK